jgi:hypothetical protein
MDSIQIVSGVKRIAINDDPERVIQFNPTDVVFAEKFYALVRDLELKQADFAARAQQIDDVKDIDANGLPVNLGQRVAFMRETCEYMHEQIDGLFGAGTSFKAFEGVMDIELITQLFEGLTPFVQKARSEKLAKYAKPKPNGGHKVAHK